MHVSLDLYTDLIHRSKWMLVPHKITFPPSEWDKQVTETFNLISSFLSPSECLVRLEEQPFKVAWLYHTNKNGMDVSQ